VDSQKTGPDGPGFFQNAKASLEFAGPGGPDGPGFFQNTKASLEFAGHTRTGPDRAGPVARFLRNILYFSILSYTGPLGPGVSKMYITNLRSVRISVVAQTGARTRARARVLICAGWSGPGPARSGLVRRGFGMAAVQNAIFRRFAP
jgi:hypothetical protein